MQWNGFMYMTVCIPYHGIEAETEEEALLKLKARSHEDDFKISDAHDVEDVRGYALDISKEDADTPNLRYYDVLGDSLSNPLLDTIEGEVRQMGPSDLADSCWILAKEVVRRQQLLGDGTGDHLTNAAYHLLFIAAEKLGAMEWERLSVREAYKDDGLEVKEDWP